MEKRKNDEKDIRRLSGLFFQIGLLAALMLAVSAFEYRTVETYNPVVVGDDNVIEDPLIPITIQDPIPPPPPVKKLKNPIPTPDPDPEVIQKEIPLDPVITDDKPIIEVPEPLPIEDAPEFIYYAEVMPTPKGGYEAFYKYVSKNMNYPISAKREGVDGKVFVQFIVDENGNLIEVKTIKGSGFGLDEEAERVLKHAPQWNPGRQAGRRVKVRMILPITFRLK